MGWKTSIRTLACMAVVTCVAPTVHAASLRDKIDGLFGREGITIATSTHVAHFSSASVAALGLLVGELAPSAADFAAISTTPGLTYKYNPELDLFERAPGSRGAVFVDVPQTVGKGHIAFGVSYEYVNFTHLNGDSLDGLKRTLHHQDTPPIGNVDEPPFELDTVNLNFDKFSLTSHVISFFGTYGLTANWDVNVLIPMVVTSMDVHGRAVIEDVGSTIHRFPDGGRIEAAETSGDKVGIGDMLLRTKYRFTDLDTFNVAAGLTLRVPTGSEDNFQGLGDVTLTPTGIIGYQIGPHDVHANAGFQIDPESLDRTRAQYAVGGSLQLVDPLSFQLDFLGSSNLTKQDTSVTVPVFSPDGSVQTGTQKVTSSFRTDIFNLAVGFKASPLGPVALFAGAIIPLNTDGLRPDVIPYGGVEATF